MLIGMFKVDKMQIEQKIIIIISLSTLNKT